MLTPNVNGSLIGWEMYAIGINMILLTVFVMLMDFINWERGCINGQPVSTTSRIPGLLLVELESMFHW